METAPSVQKGRLIVYRTFDACDSVELHDAELLLLQEHPNRVSMQFLEAPRRELGALRFAAAPLHVALGEREIDYGDGPVKADASVRIFDYGTFAVSYGIPVDPSTSFEQLVPLVARATESASINAAAIAECEKLQDKIRSVLRGQHEVGDIQRYAVLFVEQLGGGHSASTVLEWPGLPKLATCELDDRAVSAQQREDVLRCADAYLDDDLVVVGSKCSIVVEPSRRFDVVQIIELVMAQLAQLRLYDSELDRELAELYRREERSALSMALRSPYGRVLRSLSRRLIELTEFNERIDNTPKVVTDAYLTRVYQKAVERFAIPVLKARVADKHKLLLDLYTMLKDEVQMLRGLILEVLIVVLIVSEVVLALTGH
ncbi:MAG: hypothetical protein R3B13_06645 [Polyangiaceae bacterium]